MSFTHVVQTRVNQGDEAIVSTISHTTEQNFQLNESVPDSTTDKEILLAMDISGLKAFAMMADVAMTVKTNDSSTPQETFVLVAGEALIYSDGWSALFSGDVSALYVTNASGTDGTLRVIAGLDS